MFEWPPLTLTRVKITKFPTPSVKATRLGHPKAKTSVFGGYWRVYQYLDFSGFIKLIFKFVTRRRISFISSLLWLSS